MASEAKPFASLSSGLLARKGAARPAMKPQGFGQMGGANLEDLGWNDMGFEPPKPAAAPRDDSHDAFGEDVVEHPRAHPTGLTPVESPVHNQHAQIADRLGVGADAEGDEEEFDETAELYEPEAEGNAEALEAEAEAFEPEAEDFQPEVEAAEPAAPFVPVAPSPQPVAARPIASRSAPGSKPKAAFTLRLDKSRHLKLRLACAVNGRSAQQLVTDALDALLSNMPELDVMAAKAARKG